MPMPKRWTEYTLENIKRLPIDCGAYEIANKNKDIIYIGKSDNRTTGIRGRLLSHWNNRRFRTAKYFRCDFATFLNSGSDKESLHAQKYAQQHRRKPRASKRLPT